MVGPSAAHAPSTASRPPPAAGSRSTAPSRIAPSARRSRHAAMACQARQPRLRSSRMGASAARRRESDRSERTRRCVSEDAQRATPRACPGATAELRSSRMGASAQGAGEHRSERTRRCVSEERSGQRRERAQARQPWSRHVNNANAGAPDAGVRCPRDPDVEGVRVVPWRRMWLAAGVGRLPASRYGRASRPIGRTDAHPRRADWSTRPADPGDDRPLANRRRARDRALRRTAVAVGIGRLERAAEAAHPDGEVVLHDLADLRLGEELVRAERVLDAGRRVRRRRRRPGRGTAACRRRRAARAARGRASSRCPSDGIRSPRISREIVEWSTPDCWASWRCDIFLALSWARSHSLNARPFWVVMTSLGAPWLAQAGGDAMSA